MIVNQFIAKIFQAPQIYQTNQWLWAGDFFKQISELKEIKPEEKILDIACGTSNASKYISGQYYGVDLNNNYLGYARKKYPQNQYLCQDYQKIDFPKKNFDKVLIVNFLHHLSGDEVRQLLSHVNILAKDKIIIADLEPNPKNPLAKLLYSLDQGNFIRMPEELRNIIKQHFDIEKSYSFFSPRHIYKHIVFICKPRD